MSAQVYSSRPGGLPVEWQLPSVHVMETNASRLGVVAACVLAVAAAGAWAIEYASQLADTHPVAGTSRSHAELCAGPVLAGRAEHRGQGVTECGSSTTPVESRDAVPVKSRPRRSRGGRGASRIERLRRRALARGESHTLTGRVEDGAGRAVVGAEVLITTRDRREHHWSLHRSVETDAWGQFTFEWVAAGGCKIVVIPKDTNRVVVSRWVTAPFDSAPTLVAHEGRVVSGRVFRPDGRPAPSVGVVAYLAGSGERWSQADSAADGTFRLSRLPPGKIDLWAWCKRVEGTGDDREVPCDMDCRLEDIEVGCSDVVLHLRERP